MRFEIVHTFRHPVQVVEEALLDRGTGRALLPRMATVVDIEPLECEERDGVVRRRVRYVPAPLIGRIGTRRVDPRWMEWTEESEYDRAAHRMTFRNVPRVARIAELLENTGTLTLEPAPGGASRRTVQGVIRVKVPLLGALAERVIAKQGERILDEEARAFARLLDEGA